MKPIEDAALQAEVAALKGLNIDALREAWRRRFSSSPPALRGPDLMRRALADKIQSEAFGRDAEVDKRIDLLVRKQRLGQAPTAPRPAFRPGTVLAREHQGKIHHVEVLDDGFRWQGETHKSLSVIARKITGVQWNGPRFFGLREQKAAGQ